MGSPSGVKKCRSAEPAVPAPGAETRAKLIVLNRMVFGGVTNMATPEDDSDTYSEADTVTRREAALKNMLATPHKPQKPKGKKRVESHGK